LAIAGAIAAVACLLGLSAMRLAPSLASAELDLKAAHSALQAEPVPAREDDVEVERAAPVAAEVAAVEAPNSPGAGAYDVAAGASTSVTEWLAPGPRRCTRRGRRRYCDGPLRAPTPHGAAAARASRLQLGTRSAWFRALSVEDPPPEWLDELPAAPEHADLLWPVPEGFLGRGFGQQLHGNPNATPHPGHDLPAAAGAEVRAADDGLVVYAGNERHGYGNVIMLMQRSGYVSVYAHCRALFVFPGQLVERGARIAEVGKTGLAHGNHLHFEWRRRGHARDPRRHLVGRPDHEAEARLARAQRERRREAEAHLAELRARAERNARRRAHRAAQDSTASPNSP
jgi:murein DD-endopeptidase MepM/ murein hydrolase activator NlpD